MKSKNLNYCIMIMILVSRPTYNNVLLKLFKVGWILTGCQFHYRSSTRKRRFERNSNYIVPCSSYHDNCVWERFLKLPTYPQRLKHKGPHFHFTVDESCVWCDCTWLYSLCLVEDSICIHILWFILNTHITRDMRVQINSVPSLE